MDPSTRANVLVVAARTAATPKLVEEVRRRASEGPCEFTLLVPALPELVDRTGEESRAALELALPLLKEAAGGPVAGTVGACDPLLAVERALVQGSFDEVIVSTLPERVSRWLHGDLPGRIERLGVPVTVVRAEQAPWPVDAPTHFGLP
jgi:hypothetical protein